MCLTSCDRTRAHEIEQSEKTGLSSDELKSKPTHDESSDPSFQVRYYRGLSILLFKRHRITLERDHLRPMSPTLRHVCSEHLVQQASATKSAMRKSLILRACPLCFWNHASERLPDGRVLDAASVSIKSGYRTWRKKRGMVPDGRVTVHCIGAVVEYSMKLMYNA